MPRISTGTPKNLENSLRTTSSQWPSIGQAIGFAFRLLIKIKNARAKPPKAAAIKNKFKNVSISVFTTSLEPILSKIRNERKPRHSLASLGNPKKKKVPCFSDFRGGGFFLKWKGHFYFWGSALKVSGSVAGLQYGLGKTEKQFFWGKRIFRFASALFSPAERGLGNECERTSVFKKFAHLHKEIWKK